MVFFILTIFVSITNSAKFKLPPNISVLQYVITDRYNFYMHWPEYGVIEQLGSFHVFMSVYTCFVDLPSSSLSCSIASNVVTFLSSCNNLFNCIQNALPQIPETIQ